MTASADETSDFRSDTVTQPDAAMRERMMAAPLGDDVFGDDPSVQRLEADAAGWLGQEAALFCPSGTMANQIAVRVHTRPGDEVLLNAGAHVYRFEQGGLAALHGVQAVTHEHPGGELPLPALEASIRPDDPHFPRTRLVVVENTFNLGGGKVVPLAHMEELRTFTRRHGLSLHIDGARLANAAVALGVSTAVLGSQGDSVTLCLSKGLGAPAGTMLAASADFIGRARRVRKLLGGGLRQAGFLAEAGRYAYEVGFGRLAADHERAQELARVLAEVSACEVIAPQTNIVVVRTPREPAAVLTHLEAEGVRAVPFGPGAIRFTLHHHLDDADVARAARAWRSAHAAALGTPAASERLT